METNYLFATIIRLIFPLSIFIFPFWGVVFSMLLDAFDIFLPSFPGMESFPNYQYWDKALDTYYLTIAFLTTISWKDLLAKNIGLFLYSLRTIGVFLFVVTEQRYWLFFFPNFFEYYFLFYLGYKYFYKKDPLNSKAFLGIFLIIIVLKVVQEYILHYGKYEFWKWIK
jgi:hypothetical protein